MLSFRSIFLLVAVLLIGVSACSAGNPVRLMVDLSPEPDAVMLSAFDLCIVDAEAAVNLEDQQTLGNKMLARLNVFEVKARSAAAVAARSIGIPLLEGGQPDNVRLDATHPNWVPLVVYRMVQDAAERGFDGFVLTGLETISQDAERAACLQVIASLDKAYPDKKLIIEGGLDLVPEARRWLEGVLFIEAATSPQRDQRIREVKRLGVQPLVVECFSAHATSAQIADRTRHYRSMGAVPYFTTPDLQGRHLGPLQEVKRRILVIHSGPSRNTFSAKVLHGSLEWLGYQVRYAEAGAAEPWGWENHLTTCSGVILDASLTPLPQQQPALLELADSLKSRKIPLLITGAAWGTAKEFSAWSQLLAIRGTGRSMAVGRTASLRTIETSWLQDSGTIRPRTWGFRDLQAPVGARVLCSIQTDLGKGGTLFDQVFLCSWGGLWMDALATETGPQLRPLKFLENWLGEKEMTPVPDVVTQNGRRLVIPHISSEGFTTQTSLQGLPIAGEAMTERILSRYSLPFTVALSEGDIRGSNPGQDPRDSLRYESAAKALFSLPQVRAASASATRPKNWAACENMPREIAGSMAYIHRQLLPPGRRIELMLWPEGAAPTPEAVAFSRRMGVENAQPVFTGTFAGKTAPPAAATWGHADTLQSLVPSVREPGPLNATRLISQMEAESQGRWMQPVHVSLNFNDAASEESLWEMERLLDWCAAQPLQAMSLSDHARLVKDAAQTRFFRQGASHWIIVNAGHARTLRVPVQAGVPDLNRSIGIAGYTVQGEDLYIHTLGRRRTELVLNASGSPTHLRLVGSSGHVRFLEAGHQRALLQVADLRPVELTFAGIAPGAMCQIYTTEQPQFILADAHGQVAVTVPAQTTIRLQVLPNQQAVMR